MICNHNTTLPTRVQSLGGCADFRVELDLRLGAAGAQRDGAVVLQHKCNHVARLLREMWGGIEKTARSMTTQIANRRPRFIPPVVSLHTQQPNRSHLDRQHSLLGRLGAVIAGREVPHAPHFD